MASLQEVQGWVLLLAPLLSARWSVPATVGPKRRARHTVEAEVGTRLSLALQLLVPQQVCLHPFQGKRLAFFLHPALLLPVVHQLRWESHNVAWLMPVRVAKVLGSPQAWTYLQPSQWQDARKEAVAEVGAMRPRALVATTPMPAFLPMLLAAACH